MNVIPGLDVTKGCYCLKARKTARALTRHYEEYLRPHGLRATQFSILAALTLKGPTRLGELAGMLDLERTTLTRIAGLLDARGWIKDGQTDDGRERLLCVTDAGHAVLDAAFPAWQQAQQAASDRVHNGQACLGEVSQDSADSAERLDESRQFVERALRDFGLLDAFESRLALERERCLLWIAQAAGESEEEERVSRLVHDLSHRRALPVHTDGVTG